MPSRLGADKEQAIMAAVALVPKGQVAAYGDIALCLPGVTARQVGHALAAGQAAGGAPWHRIVNAQGRISERPGDGPARQRRLLEAEGVRFSAAGRIDLARHRWPGPTLDWLIAQGAPPERAFDILDRIGRKIR